MSIWESLGGMVDVELISAQLPVALRAISESGLEIVHLELVDPLTCWFQIDWRQYKKLQILAEKQGDLLRLCGKSGLYWHGKRLLNRPVLVLGLFSFLILTLWLPGRILFVEVEGNHYVPAEQILASAEAQGVTFGAVRREIRSEKIKNGILSDIPQLQWVGVNTAGCVATLSVRERSEPTPDRADPAISSIIADRDGYILSVTAVRGTSQIQPGQIVCRGQVLISGYTDCGFCIRAERAEGEIFAQTERDLRAVTPENCLVRRRELGRKRKISLLLRKKRINLWKDSGIFDSSCGRMYAEYYLTLPGGFRLPIALCLEEYTFFDMEQNIREPEAASEQLKNFAQGYLHRQMVAGAVRESKELVSYGDGLITLRGSYVCEEMIGREQAEQIGETNGKNN